MVVWIGSLSVWLVVILFTTAMKVEENDLTLEVTGGSQQAVDVVRRTVSQGERQQLLPGLQVSVSFALAEQTAHIPGQTVAWREEKAGAGSHEGREAVTVARVNLSASWRRTLSLKMQRRRCDVDTVGGTFTPQQSLGFSSCEKTTTTNTPNGLYSEKQTQLLLLLFTDRERPANQITPFPFSPSAFPQRDINEVREYNRSSRLNSEASRKDRPWTFIATSVYWLFPAIVSRNSDTLQRFHQIQL